MGLGWFLEPAVVVVILVTAVWVNRNREDKQPGQLQEHQWSPRSSVSSPTFEPPSFVENAQWRTRKFFGWNIQSRNTGRWKNTLGSLYLRKFPFLMEFWYQFCVYWAYQLGRAFSALTLKSSTVDVARMHALSVIAVEKHLGIFVERDIQQYFLERPDALAMINKIYSFIHIPGTMAFLAWLYYYAPRNLYQARRRTLAICNLMAFVVFTSWPCMPPRLLPAQDGFGFVDSVHSGGSSSVWTTNRFCNQLAAMPSLHFGYSFVIGLTIATCPVPSNKTAFFGFIPQRLLFVSLGIFYPALILLAIVATANHFILDAFAGFCISLIGWTVNSLLLNLLPLQDLVLYTCRLHKPSGMKPVVEEEWEKENVNVNDENGLKKTYIH